MNPQMLFKCIVIAVVAAAWHGGCGPSGDSTSSSVTRSENPDDETDERSRDGHATFIGEIVDYRLLGQFGFDFTGTFGGVEFELKEHPGKLFRIVTDSFDEAETFGVMKCDENGVYSFQELGGRRVEIQCQADDDDTFQVLALKMLGGSADSLSG